MAAQTIGLFEAKTRLSELVARAEQGGEVIITRHNKPVAKIVPVGPLPTFDVEKRKRAIREMQRLGRQIAKQSGQAITSDEIVGWIREDREARTEQILRAASRRKR